MLDLDQCRTATLRELDAIVAQLEVLPESGWERPVPCEGWHVAELAVHVGDVAFAQGEAFHRMLRDSVDAPGFPDLVDRSPSDSLANLAKGRAHLASAYSRLAPEHMEALVPLPFATLPTAFALTVPLIEYGVHCWDLRVALGAEARIPDDVADTIIELLPAFLPMITTECPSEPTAYRLVTPLATVSVMSSAGNWVVGGEGGVEVCEIAGDTSSVALFAMGRLSCDHPALHVSGAMHNASDFKRYFPGP